jgi:RNA-directed DNA polymerase
MAETNVLEKAIGSIEERLRDMGLQLSPSKTRVTHTLTPYEGNVGFDFLGFHVQQYPVGKTRTGKDTHGRPLGFTTTIQPSKEGIKRHLREIKQRLRKLHDAPQKAVISELNPISRGWSTYCRWVVCRKAFDFGENVTYLQLVRWAQARHPTKGTAAAKEKYWIRLDTRSVYGTYIQDKTGTPQLIYVKKHTETRSQDYVKVRGNASPHDGNLLYWAKRLKQHPMVNTERAKLLKAQQWQCTSCELSFQGDDLLEVDHVIPTVLGGTDDLTNKILYHRHCHDVKTARDAARIAKLKAEGINHN